MPAGQKVAGYIEFQRGSEMADNVMKGVQQELDDNNILFQDSIHVTVERKEGVSSCGGERYIEAG